MTEKPCHTIGCGNVARWISITEGNAGMTDRRCQDCCDAISAHSIPAGGLITMNQLRPWARIHDDFKTTGEDGIRRVLAMTDRGTSLVRWYGPVA